MKTIVGSVLALTLILVPSAPGQDLPSQSAVHQPQVVASGDGNLLFVWKERAGRTANLFAAVLADGTFGPKLRVNSVPDSVVGSPIDEMRAALAIGPSGEVAIAWTDAEFNIQTAIAPSAGAEFRASLRLNQTEGRVLQEFPSITFDEDGALHAVWLDPRSAGRPGAEEPADLYYARVRDGEVMEQNLTASQDSSVCGCCLPSIVESGGLLEIVFRNTTPDGYRDPFKIVGTTDGGFKDPRPISPAIWQIRACPVAGPIQVGDAVLWFDGSTGVRRLLAASRADREPAVVLEDSDQWTLRYPPRLVSGSPSLLLVPGRPAGYLMRYLGGTELSLEASDLPAWATSAAVLDGYLHIVGTEDNSFRYVTQLLGAVQ